METLRDLLKQKNPELHSAFLETWKYLENSILPTMSFNSKKSESFNSLPHLKNNENYLNGLIPVSEKILDYNQAFFLSQYEIYAILSSIALHDIGRIRESKGHGAESNKMIVKEKLWEKLRIPNRELAIAIGNICEIHEPKEMKKEMNPEIEIVLSDKGVESITLVSDGLYEANGLSSFPIQMLDNTAGPVRVNELGALLSLVDNMDATYRRLAPLDLIGKENYETSIGSIRNLIKGVSYSRESQAIVVSIDVEQENVHSESNINTHKIYEKNCLFDFINWFRKLGSFKLSGHEVITQLIEKAKLSEFALEDFFSAKTIFTEKYLVDNKLLLELIWQIINSVHINKIEYFKAQKSLSPIISMASVLGNIRTCHRSLINKYKYLNRLGIPVKTWLIYIEEHLYNYFGVETFEPVFTKSYLKLVAKKMWELSTRVFGQSFFTYEMLASAANEKDLTLIKLAVKRIEIVSRNLQNDINDLNKKPVSAINYNLLGWQWEFYEEDRKCKYIHINDINEIIENLSDPILKSKK